VLREDVDEAAIDAAMPGDDAVAVHPLVFEAEVGGAVGDEAVVLDEGALVEEEVESLACGELAFGVLGLDAGLAAPFLGLGSALLQDLEFVAHGHGRES